MGRYVEFGCIKCGSYHVRDKEGGRLYCTSCGCLFEAKHESEEQRDARIKFLSRLDDAEKHLRMSPPRFDDAEDRFRDFIKKYPNSSDGYWGLVRAKYGIKYEEDISGKLIPSCYKSSYDDFTADSDFIKALQTAESEKLRLKYMSDAQYISGVCKEWREETKKNQYDIFISFKASDDATGDETADSREMKDLYLDLNKEGYKIFFSPVTMKSYAGKHYDAHIFNALQTAKVMIVYGSKPEYFTSTWVENEWTRFLRMQAKGEKRKDSCIVAYEGFSPKELPHLLRGIQAIDASKKSFYKEITACVKALLDEEKPVAPEENLNTNTNARLADVYYDNGFVNQESGDYKEAFEYYKKAAELGHTLAQCNLAMCYDFGRGVSQNYKEAFRWYSEAADSGNTEAQFRLGYFYQQGQGTEKNLAKAKDLYSKAAGKGHAMAQNHLGTCYDFGYGVEKDYKQAFRWYSKAAEAGIDDAQFRLGYFYQHGQGVTQDLDKAKEWYKKAIKQNNGAAKKALSDIEEAEAKALEEKRKAAERERQRREKEQAAARAAYKVNNIDWEEVLVVIGFIAMLATAIAAIVFTFMGGRLYALLSIITGVVSIIIAIVLCCYLDIDNAQGVISLITGILIFIVACIGFVRLFGYYGTTDMIISNGTLKECYVNQETVELPDGITEIAGTAFSGDIGLRGEKIKCIILPDSVKYITTGAFAGCKSLEEVYLGPNIRSIGSVAFARCEKLERIYFDGTEAEWNAIEKEEGMLFGLDSWDSGISNYEIVFLK